MPAHSPRLTPAQRSALLSAAARCGLPGPGPAPSARTAKSLEARSLLRVITSAGGFATVEITEAGWQAVSSLWASGPAPGVLEHHARGCTTCAARLGLPAEACAEDLREARRAGRSLAGGVPRRRAPSTSELQAAGRAACAAAVARQARPLSPGEAEGLVRAAAHSASLALEERAKEAARDASAAAALSPEAAKREALAAYLEEAVGRPTAVLRAAAQAAFDEAERAAAGILSVGEEDEPHGAGCFQRKPSLAECDCGVADRALAYEGALAPSAPAPSGVRASEPEAVALAAALDLAVGVSSARGERDLLAQARALLGRDLPEDSKVQGGFVFRYRQWRRVYAAIAEAARREGEQIRVVTSSEARRSVERMALRRAEALRGRLLWPVEVELLQVALEAERKRAEVEAAARGGVDLLTWPDEGERILGRRPSDFDLMIWRAAFRPTSKLAPDPARALRRAVRSCVGLPERLPLYGALEGVYLPRLREAELRAAEDLGRGLSAEEVQQLPELFREERRTVIDETAQGLEHWSDWTPYLVRQARDYCAAHAARKPGRQRRGVLAWLRGVLRRELTPAERAAVAAVCPAAPLPPTVSPVPPVRLVVAVRQPTEREALLRKAAQAAVKVEQSLSPTPNEGPFPPARVSATRAAALQSALACFAAEAGQPSDGEETLLRLWIELGRAQARGVPFAGLTELEAALLAGVRGA